MNAPGAADAPGLTVRWRALDPAGVAARLSVVLEADIVTGTLHLLGQAWLLVEPAAPGVREDRLAVATTGPTLVEPPAPGASRSTPGAPGVAGGGPWILAIGWATVDRDRAAAGLPGSDDRHRAWRSGTATEAAADGSLGADAGVVSIGGGAPLVVLLEPSTEGRLAASLARLGESPVAIYLGWEGRSIRAEAGRLRRAGLSARRIDRGPLGPQVLVRGTQPWGPHLIVVGAATPGEAHVRADDKRVPSTHE